MKTSPSIDVLRSYSKSPRIGKMVFLSMALHIMMILAMFYLPNLASTRTFYSPVYSVRLVNIPPSLGPVRESAPNRSAETLPSVPPPPSPVVEKPKVKEQAKPISLSPTKKEEAEKKVADAIERIRQRRESKSIDSAIERIRDEKEARQVSSAIEGIRSEKETRQVSSAIEGIRSEKETRQVSSAIERIRSEKETRQVSSAIEGIRSEKETRQVSSAIEGIRSEKETRQVSSTIEGIRSEKETRQVSSAIEGIRKRVTTGSSGAVETVEGGTGGMSSGIMSIKFKIYYNLIWQRIRSVWALPEEALGGKKNLETIITIRIAKDGQIEDMQFEKKSGNAFLDESALRAIKKANPLPPLPRGMEGDKLDVGVRFMPSEL